MGPYLRLLGFASFLFFLFVLYYKFIFILQEEYPIPYTVKKQLSDHLTLPCLDPPQGSFLVQREASVSSRKRTCLIFHSSPSLNSHPLREVFSQLQKDPKKTGCVRKDLNSKKVYYFSLNREI